MSAWCKGGTAAALKKDQFEALEAMVRLPKSRPCLIRWANRWRTEKIMRHFQYVCVGVLFLGFLGGIAPQADGALDATQSSLPVPQFQKGDRWCVVGDSITHSGEYHEYVYLFYATRFPERRFEMWNCGVAGDQASNVLTRAAWDILPHRPTVSTIMLGMNDIGRGSYAASQVETGKGKREAALEKYSKNMRTLAEMLSNAGSRLIFLSPTPFDDTAYMSPAKAAGVVNINGGLIDCLRREREIAADFSAPCVDLIHPLMELVAEQQKLDPRFTLVRADRVHPEPPGHFVAAFWFLKAQDVPAVVSRMVVDASEGKATGMENCSIEGVKTQPGGVAFSCTENALPYPMSPEMLPALPWVPFVKEMDQEILQVTHLPAGSYQVMIDDQPVATFTSGALAAGVNLATETTTPQYQQAERAMALNAQRDELEKTHVRSIQYVEKALGRPKDASDMTTLEKAKAGKSANPFVQSMYDSYGKMKPIEEESEKQVDALRAQLWDVVQVKPHAYRIVPVGK
jgi:lysophospholipase L1-like esterase